MGYPLKQNTTARPLVFLLLDEADHLTGKTGLSPTVTLSKNGDSFAAAAGAVTEIGNGLYKVAGNATDSNTLGPLILHAVGAGADPCDDEFEVVSELSGGWASGDIDGYTLEEALKLVLAAAAAGKLSGAGTTTVTIRAADDSKARITATVDEDGNRMGLTLDATG